MAGVKTYRNIRHYGSISCDEGTMQSDIRRDMRSQKRKPNRFQPEAQRVALPLSVEPMLPTLTAKPFSDPGWLFEPKWDGWRTLCFVCDGRVHLVSRAGDSLPMSIHKRASNILVNDCCYCVILTRQSNSASQNLQNK
jgi:hypothetical protein